mmetsp:Transcript_17461/g.38013  ORF Transcript_17461/g.38013 Transcript_17461/m.38013 type:complete len:386 (-) Transcript_17461:405-1562(-)|eukprot:CAMPEP_0118923098 /NCGR_PEP_ID=MMETSP1169-20130426/1755_1 /TAXON_ID=36882 /ORGANISM="Pyramimonas obovata, Strain CCMP722" /LENGTH=385 /DNA_ID=CAMNT_0006864041 /DNA_START=336 /DNA_END=1493 /DNA_ORIENTATION=-
MASVSKEPETDVSAKQVDMAEQPQSAGPFESNASIAHIGLACLSVAPLFVPVEPNTNIILTASLAIYAGSHRSIKATPMQETMTQKDAMKFPIVGSCVLFGLFLLFKFLPKDIVNAVLTAYFVFLGIIALTATLRPFINKLLPASLHTRDFKLGTVPKIPYVLSEPMELAATSAEIFGGVISIGFCVWYFKQKHWIANNVLGLAFSIQGIEFLSVGSVKIGAILLSGLFLYDIFWVFCTPVMVSVAKSFDAPIKLLFPRAMDLVNAERPFSMLGLGDIVVPGIFVAILLRFDNQRANKGKAYFYYGMVGYVLGLATTIIVMNLFNAAQPALLYIVPGVLGAVGVRSLLYKETDELLAYDEGSAPEIGEEGSTPDEQKEGEVKKDE